ncbi:hypothetical protein [Arthrobacter sp. B1805]|uniref:hypothetical protein n=1 Tax=Arthrobacter sp. B1805 TaxID=2058892 RepID=UPI0015E28756|nr:hypothetical protein [Arthrobacter sp. B1805]
MTDEGMTLCPSLVTRLLVLRWLRADQDFEGFARVHEAVGFGDVVEREFLIEDAAGTAKATQGACVI